MKTLVALQLVIGLLLLAIFYVNPRIDAHNAQVAKAEHVVCLPADGKPRPPIIWPPVGLTEADKPIELTKPRTHFHLWFGNDSTPQAPTDICLKGELDQ